MLKTPSNIRPHIILLGRRNVGKSSLLNAISKQPIALVSHIAGTTTDPVNKPYELLPFGPVVFVDTAGLDDEGELGELRIERTRKQLKSADLGILVVEAGKWTEFEDNILKELEDRKIPYFIVVNKNDVDPKWKLEKASAYVSAESKMGIEDFRWNLVQKLREINKSNDTVVSDIVNAGDFIILVVPIDLDAPKGRLILPQVMTIRDILDNDGITMIVKERELWSTLRQLKNKPNLVITDSQVVLKVVGDLPNDIKMTTFSILFARLKGDLMTLVKGVTTIDKLQDGDKVLISEACSHHSLADDIGGVKIPRWIRQYTGKNLTFDKVQGKNYPDNLKDYSLVIHCGGCMLTKNAMSVRMDEAVINDIPITNYGITISYVQGVLKRALSPFPEISILLD